MKFSQLVHIPFFLFTIFMYGQTTRIFISAHQDDWQLFMNPNVYQSIKSSEDKTIIIHTTAGEAGDGLGNDSYYKAREEGSLRAIRFLSNTYSSGKNIGNEMERSYASINSHRILRYGYRNTNVYLLRLPDGNGNGTGYEIHDFKSLKKLNTGEISNFLSIDGQTNYTNRKDLIETLKRIFEIEKGENKLEIHLADTDSERNPDDHSDHQNSSKLAQEAAKLVGNLTLYFYVNYYTSELEQNVFDHDFLVSAGTWGVTTSGISDYRHYSTWDDSHNVWIGRQYFRKEYLK